MPDTISEPASTHSSRFQIEQQDTHDFSHYLIFRKSTGWLISISRNYEEERAVDKWFPANDSKPYYWTGEDKSRYPAPVRRLPGGRVLLAMGVSDAGGQTSQVALILMSELEDFYPWLAKQLPDTDLGR